MAVVIPPHLAGQPGDAARIILAAEANRRGAAGDVLQGQIARERIASEEYLQGQSLAARKKEAADRLALEREQSNQLMQWRQAQMEANQQRYAAALRLRQEIEQRKAAAAVDQMEGMLGVQRDIANNVPESEAIARWAHKLFAPSSKGGLDLATSLQRTRMHRPRFGTYGGAPFAYDPYSSRLSWRPGGGAAGAGGAGDIGSLRYPREGLETLTTSPNRIQVTAIDRDLSQSDLAELAELRRLMTELRDRRMLEATPKQLKRFPSAQAARDEYDAARKRQIEIFDKARAREAARRARAASAGAAAGFKLGADEILVQSSITGKIVPIKKDQLPALKAKDPGVKVIDPSQVRIRGAGGAGGGFGGGGGGGYGGPEEQMGNEADLQDMMDLRDRQSEQYDEDSLSLGPEDEEGE